MALRTDGLRRSGCLDAVAGARAPAGAGVDRESSEHAAAPPSAGRPILGVRGFPGSAEPAIRLEGHAEAFGARRRAAAGPSASLRAASTA